MSPESNVQEKALTVTMAPPPAAVAADKKKAEKKRSETDNLIDGHADTIKGAGKLSAEQEAKLLRKQGRTGAGVGFVLLGIAAFMQLVKYGGFLRTETVNGLEVKATLEQAYHKLAETPWLFVSAEGVGLTTRLMAFRIFFSLSAFFLVALVAFPGLFGKSWMKLGHALGFVMTHVLLGVMFYLAFTPLSLLLKLFGRDPLRLAKHEGTYWVDRSDHKRAANHFEHLS